MSFNQNIAFGVVLLVYALIVAYWLWAGIAYMRCIQRLPASKDQCKYYGTIVLNKIFLGAVITGPASALFSILKQVIFS